MKCWACGSTKEVGPAKVLMELDVLLCRLCWWRAGMGKELLLEFETPPEHAFVNVLLYGPPKTAKTGGAASAPGSTLYLNLDLPNAIRDAHQRHNTDGRIKWVRYKGIETLVDIHSLVNGHAGDIPDNIVVDPVGDLYRRLLEEESGRAIKPTLNQYGAVGTHLERFCRMLCEAPVNAIFICHDLPMKDEATGEMMRLPFTGSASNPTLGQKLMGMVDIIAYTGVMEQEDGNLEYWSQLIMGKGRQGGDRFSSLGNSRPTNLAEWFVLIREHEDNLKATPAPEGHNEKEKVAV